MAACRRPSYALQEASLRPLAATGPLACWRSKAQLLQSNGFQAQASENTPLARPVVEAALELCRVFVLILPYCTYSTERWEPPVLARRAPWLAPPEVTRHVARRWPPQVTENTLLPPPAPGGAAQPLDVAPRRQTK
jgi:hypothetical protein